MISTPPVSISGRRNRVGCLGGFSDLRNESEIIDKVVRIIGSDVQKILLAVRGVRKTVVSEQT